MTFAVVKGDLVGQGADDGVQAQSTKNNMGNRRHFLFGTVLTSGCGSSMVETTGLER